MAAKYILARSAGFCFGVERSIRMAEEALASGACRCLGELIHNRDAVTALEKKGLSVIEKASELPEGDRVIIRAHGVSRAVYTELKNRRAGVIDATCPLVERIHKIVREESDKGRQIVVIGDAEHPEIRGICGWCTGAVVLRTPRRWTNGSRRPWKCPKNPSQLYFRLHKFKQITFWQKKY